MPLPVYCSLIPIVVGVTLSSISNIDYNVRMSTTCTHLTVASVLQKYQRIVNRMCQD